MFPVSANPLNPCSEFLKINWRSAKSGCVIAESAPAIIIKKEKGVDDDKEGETRGEPGDKEKEPGERKSSEKTVKVKGEKEKDKKKHDDDDDSSR